MDMPKKQIVAEALIDLHRRLSTLPTRSHERRMIMQESSEAEERSAPFLDRRDRLPRHDIRIGGLGEREAEVSQVVAGTIGFAEDEN